MDNYRNETPGQLNRRLTERVLDLRAKSYLYNIRSELLSEVVFGLNASRTSLGQVNTAFSDILSRVAHEVRTQLNSIVGMMNVLFSRDSDDLSESQKDILDQVNQASRYLLNLSYNMVTDYGNSDQELKKRKLSNSDFCVQDLVTEVFTDLLHLDKFQCLDHARAENEGLEQLFIFADHLLFKNFLTYLGSLLLDHLNAGDRLKLSVEQADVRVLNFKYEAVMGNARTAGFLHDLLIQSGMGMLFLENLIKLAGGTIFVRVTENILRVETRHVFSKNVEKTETDYLEFAGEFRKDGKPLVLYIDDNLMSLQIYRKIIEHHTDFEVQIATGVKIGFRMLKNELPDLILLDIRMPEIDGFQALRILKKHELCRSIPVIAFTADSECMSPSAALDIGFAEFLVKGMSSESVIETINRHIRKRD